GFGGGRRKGGRGILRGRSDPRRPWAPSHTGGRAEAGDAPVTPPQASGEPIRVVGSDAGSRFVQLGIGKSVVIDLPRDVKDVLVAEPKFANAVVRSTGRAYLIGVAVGQTNIYFFDAEARQISGLDVALMRALKG